MDCTCRVNLVQFFDYIAEKVKFFYNFDHVLKLWYKNIASLPCSILHIWPQILIQAAYRTLVTMISNTFGPICYFYGILRSELCIVRPKRNYLRCIVKVMNHYAVNYCALSQQYIIHVAKYHRII